MSTKIYNGRILAGPIGKVYGLLLAAKPEAVAIARGLEASWLARRATHMIDDARIKDVVVAHPLSDAWSEFMDRRRAVQREGRRDPAIDFELELWLFPRRSTTLAIVNTEQRELREWFDRQPWVSDYSYYDNTDPPDDLTARQWRARRRAWDAVLPGAGVPSERCLTFSIADGGQYRFFGTDEVLRHAPTIEERLRRVVDQRLTDRHHARLTREEKEKDPDFDPKGFSLVFRAVDAAKADVEGRRAVEAELAPMVRAIGADDLTGRKAED